MLTNWSAQDKNSHGYQDIYDYRGAMVYCHHGRKSNSIASKPCEGKELSCFRGLGAMTSNKQSSQEALYGLQYS